MKLHDMLCEVARKVNLKWKCIGTCIPCWAVQPLSYKVDQYYSKLIVHIPGGTQKQSH